MTSNFGEYQDPANYSDDKSSIDQYEIKYGDFNQKGLADSPPPIDRKELDNEGEQQFYQLPEGDDCDKKLKKNPIIDDLRNDLDRNNSAFIKKAIIFSKNKDFTNDEEYNNLISKYLQAKDGYNGIGIVINSKFPNYDSKKEFIISDVYENTIAHEIGLAKGDKIVLNEYINILELIADLRSGNLDKIKEIKRADVTIISKDLLDSQSLYNNAILTTKIEYKKDKYIGNFNSASTEAKNDAKLLAGKIKEILSKKDDATINNSPLTSCKMLSHKEGLPTLSRQCVIAM